MQTAAQQYRGSKGQAKGNSHGKLTLTLVEVCYRLYNHTFSPIHLKYAAILAFQEPLHFYIPNGENKPSAIAPSLLKEYCSKHPRPSSANLELDRNVESQALSQT